MRPVFVFAPDLMDRSRISAAIPHAQFVTAVDQLARVDPEAVVLVDLGRPRVLEAIPTITGPVVGFASHVDETLMAAARDAGCAEVLPRSRFFRRLADFATDTGQTDSE
ncbi:MAG TPA: hypothetical protein VM282_20715 [Acidimicrobiales bacterium]|nr:hypothetical protein [Acidimicrobiales bacterium]